MKSHQHYYSENPQVSYDIKKIFENIRGISLVLEVSPGVFSSDGLDKGTRYLIENLILPPTLEEKSDRETNILDLGAGIGPISIWIDKFLHQRKSIDPNPINQYRIYASEINKRAIWLLNRNIRSNVCEYIKILKGNFIDQSQNILNQNLKFDAVFSNPPLKTGHKYLLEMFQGIFNILSPNGFIQYVHKKTLGANGFMNKLKKIKPDWEFQILRKISGFYIIIISPHEIDLNG